MGLIKKIVHWFQHITGTNTGSIVTWAQDGYIFIGFECSHCKKIDNKTINKLNESEILNGRTKYSSDTDLDIVER
jgi:hypothetical protein